NLWGASLSSGAQRTEPEQDAKEVWFAGVHSDVGGGYPPADSMLWKYSFAWMVREAAAAGAKFDSRGVEQFLGAISSASPWASTEGHQSLKGLWWICECLPKKYWDDHAVPPSYHYRIPLGKPRQVPSGAQLHRSIIERMRALADYRPPNLEAGFVSRVLASAPATETVPYTPGADRTLVASPTPSPPSMAST